MGLGGLKSRGREADQHFGSSVLQSKWCRPETGLKWGVGLPYSSGFDFFFLFPAFATLAVEFAEVPNTKAEGEWGAVPPVDLAGLATSRPAAGKVVSEHCLSLPEQMTMPGI